jgi:hypothetical protein
MSNVAVVRLFAKLRWRVLRGALNSDGAQKWAVAVGLIGSVLVGAIAAAVLFVSGRTVDDPTTLFVIATVGITFSVMMIGVIAGLAQPVDPRVLATEPLTERQLGLGVLAASASGPPGLSAGLVGFGIFAGAVRGVSSIPVVTLGAVALLATLLLVSRTTVNALGLLAVRFPRAGQLIVGLASLAFYAVFQIVPRAVRDVGADERAQIADGLSWTPMGQIGRALGIAGDDPWTALGHVAVGSLWLVPLAWIFTWSTRRLLVAAPREQRRRARSERRHPLSAVARRACGPGAVGAVAWRGVLTRLRTPRTALETFTGAGVGLAIVLVPALTIDDVGAGAVLVGGAVQLAVLFMAGNSFGSDGPATASEILTGVEPAVLVRGKARSVAIVASPIALLGPLIAAGVAGEWNYLPAGVLVGVGGLLAGAGGAMVQSILVPIAIPESDNPLATGDSNKGWFAAFALALVLAALAVVTLPVALALFWAVSQESLGLVTVFAVLTLGAGALVFRGGVAIAAHRWSADEPGLFASITPTR